MPDAVMPHDAARCRPMRHDAARCRTMPPLLFFVLLSTLLLMRL
jgi:hypothetical protein